MKANPTFKLFVKICVLLFTTLPEISCVKTETSGATVSPEELFRIGKSLTPSGGRPGLEALKYLQKACAMGYNDACLTIYYDDLMHDVYNTNALKGLITLADNGDKISCYWVAHHYFYGSGNVSERQLLCNYYYLLGSEFGDPDCFNRLNILICLDLLPGDKVLAKVNLRKSGNDEILLETEESRAQRKCFFEEFGENRFDFFDKNNKGYIFEPKKR